jgi:transposase
MRSVIEFIDMDREELNQLVERARASLSAEEYRKLKGVVEALSYLTDLVADQETTIHDLRELLFPASTEKTEAVLKKAGIEQTSKAAAENPGPSKPGEQKPLGHGRNGAKDYRNPRRVTVGHASLKHGDRCPGCLKGKVYAQQEPRQLVRIVGQAPLAATVYELERLRCNLCGEVYSADAPEGVGEDKYDESAAAMIAQLKYGTGMPFYRLENLEQNLGIPLPASTQWEIVEEAAELIKSARDELIRQAAQGEVLHNDDTSMKVLALQRAIAEEAGDRTGIFTSGVVSTGEGRKIALFFTGRQHAGRELGRGAKAACGRATHAHPDVGCVVAQCTETHQVISRQLPSPWKAAVCSDYGQLSGTVSACAGIIGRGIPPGPTGARAWALACRSVALSPAKQQAGNGQSAPMVGRAAEGKPSGAKLRLGQSDQIHAPALASAHFVSARAGCSPRQQPV